MADTKISDLTALTTPDVLDLAIVVDVSDTTMAASGTNKKTTVAGLGAAMTGVVHTTGAETIAGVKTFSLAPSAATDTGPYATERWGSGAAPGVTTATGNTVIGNSAGPDLTTGSNNTIIGFQAAGSLTTGINNTIIGAQVTVHAAMDGCTVIGRSLTFTGTPTNAVVIGYSNAVAFSDVIALGILANPTKNNQFVTSRAVDAWTMMGLSSTSTRPVAEFQKTWATSTDASRAGRLMLGAYYTTTWQESIRVEANSAGARLSFFAATAVAQQAANADTSGATLAALETEVNELKALLRAYGLMAP